MRLWAAAIPVAALAQCAPECAPVAPTTVAWSVDWDDVAWCESGGRWDYPPVTNRSGTYTGGLMIWTKAWDQYGGEEFSSDAYLTTKENQIVVAERILAENGRGAWDCL